MFRKGIAPFLLVAALAMSGCAAGIGEGTSSGPVSELSNKLVEVHTPELRAVRACMATAIMAEIKVYRLNYHGGTLNDRDLALAAINRMEKSIQKVKADGDFTWIETEMFYVRAAILREVAPQVRSRVLTAASAAISGNFRSLLSTLKATAGQFILADRMIVDINRYFNSNDLTEEDGLYTAWAVCEDRVRFNKAALGG